MLTGTESQRTGDPRHRLGTSTVTAHPQPVLTSSTALPWQLLLRAEPGPAPLQAIVPGPGGGTDAAAVLACHRDNGTLVLGQHDPDSSDVSLTVIGSSPRGRQHAIVKLAETISGLPRPWRLFAASLDHGTATLLSSALRGAHIRPARPVPYLQVDGQPLPKAVRRQSSRSQRRITEAELTSATPSSRDKTELLLLRDVIEAAHITRDRTAGRPGDLLRPGQMEFWRAVWNAAADTGQLEVTTMLLDGDLAAYCAAIIEPPFCRVFDSRMISRFEHYFPGRGLEAEVVRRAATNPGLRVVDWVLPEEAGLIALTGLDERWAVTAAGP